MLLIQIYLKLELPMLAVCYGAVLSHFSGGEVAASNTREYGKNNLSL
jgi:GMP synthase (glutamine-hydrolysing)